VDLLGLIGWPQADRAAEFGALLLVAVLISAFTRRPSLADERGLMPLYFICDFTALLRFGTSLRCSWPRSASSRARSPTLSAPDRCAACS